MTKSNPAKRDRILLAVAVFKYIKALGLVLIGIGATRMLSPAAREHAEAWAAVMAWRYDQAAVPRLFGLFDSLNTHKFLLVALAAFGYAALFAVEGTGLWLQKRWAEYLTIAATSSLLPFEVVEEVRKVTPLRSIALAANILIIVYLVLLLRRHREQ